MSAARAPANCRSYASGRYGPASNGRASRRAPGSPSLLRSVRRRLVTLTSRTNSSRKARSSRACSARSRLRRSGAPTVYSLREVFGRPSLPRRLDCLSVEEFRNGQRKILGAHTDHLANLFDALTRLLGDGREERLGDGFNLLRSALGTLGFGPWRWRRAQRATTRSPFGTGASLATIANRVAPYGRSKCRSSFCLNGCGEIFNELSHEGLDAGAHGEHSVDRLWGRVKFVRAHTHGFSVRNRDRVTCLQPAPVRRTASILAPTLVIAQYRRMRPERETSDACAVDQVQNAVVGVWWGEPRASDLDVLASRLARLHQSNPAGVYLYTVITSTTAMPGSDAREHLRHHFESMRGKLLAMAVALEKTGLEGSFSRAVLSTVLVIARHPFPLRIVSTVERQLNGFRDILAHLHPACCSPGRRLQRACGERAVRFRLLAEENLAVLQSTADLHRYRGRVLLSSMSGLAR